MRNSVVTFLTLSSQEILCILPTCLQVVHAILCLPNQFVGLTGSDRRSTREIFIRPQTGVEESQEASEASCRKT